MAGSKKENILKRFLKWGVKILFRLLVVIIILTIFQVILLRFINPPFTASMAYGWARSLISSEAYSRPRYNWTPIKDISPFLIKAVLASEDQRFMSHHGFDFIEMNHAVRDILTDRRVRGASTISMQVARSVFLWPGRNLIRKASEAYYTILIELFLGKVRILEIYLNVVDWGNGVIGAEAASLKYFHRSSSEITASQAARMAAILPSPHRWSPVYPNDKVKEREKRIMKDMAKMHL